jgi:hypothetical protein
MKRGCIWFACLLWWASTPVPSPAQVPTRVAYTLVDGSYFMDDCPVCDRLIPQLPMRGTFELVLQQDTGYSAQYAVRNLDFTAGGGTFPEYHITGQGTYTRFGEVAVLQNMTLSAQVQDPWTNHIAYFTNNSDVVEQPFPLIQMDLTDTNGTDQQTFRLHLFAAPVREIWFSTAKGFTSTNRFAPTNQISAGDLLSNLGRVVKRNSDLVGPLGIMPPVPDLGLDAVSVTRRGEILFSIPVNVHSERLGQIHHGDLLSNRGMIVKTNQALLAAFHPTSTADAGLDAVQVMPGGQILFSIQSDVTTMFNQTLSRGDILSDHGVVFMTQQQLLAKFQPADPEDDFGLDAFYVLPSGEVWFSVEQGFRDERLGQIQAGDLLSSFGYRVCSNAALLAAFAPADPSQDYGLDGLFLVADTQVAKPPPRITSSSQSGGCLHLGWDGEGAVFQVETAPSLSGPWTPASEVVPDLTSDSPCGATAGGSGFYRLRQW